MNNSKSNKQFMILSALGIFFVVDTHALSPFAFEGDFFPYNSYFMPMFVFISGYFFKPEKIQHLGTYFKGKVKKLVIPLLFWNLVYGILVNTLRYLGITNYGDTLNLRALLLEPFLGCLAYEFNNPAWFVSALFCVVVVYALLRKALGRIWNEGIMSVLLVIIGTVSVYWAKQGAGTTEVGLILSKTGFFLQFYQMGYLYKTYVEALYKKIHPIVRLIVPVLVNSVLTYKLHDLNYFNISVMSGFTTDYPIVPFITSMTGICFWLTVAEILVPTLGDSRLVNYISDNTYTVMMHHIFFFNIYNLLLAGLVKLSVLNIPFDFESFRNTAWYRFEPIRACDVWYVFFGMAGPLLVKYMFQKIHQRIKSKELNICLKTKAYRR